MIKNLIIPVATVLLYVALGVVPLQGAEQFPFNSYKDIEQLFEDKGYTVEAWQKGIREVPRLYLTTFPKQWKELSENIITVQIKKRLFFRLLGHMVLHSNELILAERERLQNIAGQDFYEKEDREWLQSLSRKYGVSDDATTKVNKEQVRELLKRVDIISPSLAMAQGANESGWGTSRFAKAGNSLFGQWTWGGRGIASKGKQKGKGNYKVAAFDQPIDSIIAYMLNLNSHRAYASLRDERAAIRSRGEKPTGLALVDTMDKYS